MHTFLIKEMDFLNKFSGGKIKNVMDLAVHAS